MRAKLIGQTVENAKRDTGKKTASGETGCLTEFGENVSHCGNYIIMESSIVSSTKRKKKH